ncbi:MAG: hypothetical protein ACI8ZO_001518 [Flavobacteriales bacterium]|jgi:hypothetical protein
MTLPKSVRIDSVITIVLLIIPAVLYVVKFNEFNLSKEPNDWGVLEISLEELLKLSFH